MINFIHGVLSDIDFNFVHPIKTGKNPIKIRLMRDYNEIYNRYPLLEIDFTIGKDKDTIQIPLSEDTELLNQSLSKITDAQTWYMAHYYATATIKLFNMLYELEDIIKDNLKDITSILACPADFFVLQDKIKNIREHYKSHRNYPFAEPILALVLGVLKDRITPAWGALQYAAGRIPRDYAVEVDGFKLNCRWIAQCKNTKYPGILIETRFLLEEGNQPEKVDLLMSANDKEGKVYYYFDFDEIGYRTFFFDVEVGYMLSAKIRNQTNLSSQNSPFAVNTGMLRDLFVDITQQNGEIIDPICTFDELDPTTNLSLWIYQFYELASKGKPDALS